MNFEKAKANSGFKMEGYYVWCGSPVKESGRYYLLAPRWPKETAFPSGYLSNSEIVLASAPSLDRPFQFEKVVIGKREGGYWDSAMAHNPFVLKVGEKYVMFYIGSPDGGMETRAIGYAVADCLQGEWVRSDTPLDLPSNANNPCVLQDRDGKYLLYFRDGALKVSVARAENCCGPYEILQYDLFPKGPVEDMFVYIENGKYEMIAEDCIGAFTGIEKAGVKFYSDNGIDWEAERCESAYQYDVEYDDGTRITLQRRERPIILRDGEDGYLFTGAKTGGPDKLTGGDTWNLVQKIAK